jgi:hypothetical protein
MATKKESEKQQKQKQTEEKAHTGTVDSKAIADDAQAESNINQELDELVQTLQGELNDIEIEAALGLIDHWQGVLSKSKMEGGKEVASDLKELQKMLKGGKATGHEISEMLIHIGEQAGDFASSAEKGSKQVVQRLGKQLRKAGTSIAKAEDQEMHEQLDTIVETVENDELTSLDSETAVASIDFWYAILNKAEGEQFKQVANSLKSLKQALSKENSKPETIAKALAQVAEQTTEIAAETPRGFKGIVQKLGKQLSAAGESLTAEKADAE